MTPREHRSQSQLDSLRCACILVQEMTRGSCVVGWVQLDNQTNDPVAPVVMAPTMVEHPQATLQMSFIRNNIKSHSHLNHFEVKYTLEVTHDFVAFAVASGLQLWRTVLPLALQGSCSGPLMLVRVSYFCVFPSRIVRVDGASTMKLWQKKHSSPNTKLLFDLFSASPN